MIRALLDTNVLASGLVRANLDSAPVLLLDLWAIQRFDLVVSEHLLAELVRTLNRPYFLARVSREEAATSLDRLRIRAEIIAPTVVVSGVASHPEDDLILAAALSAKVDYLVTGDRALLKLRAYERIPIVSAAAFLATLDAATT